MITQVQLKEKLAGITVSLENGVKNIQIEQELFVGLNNPTSNNTESIVNTQTAQKFNIIQICIGTISTALLFYLVNKIFGNQSVLSIVLGALIGAVSSVFVQYKKMKSVQLPETTSNKPDNLNEVKKKIVSEIQTTNQWVRDYWEEKIRSLIVEVKESIQKTDLSEYEQSKLINSILVNKSIIISDYHYTDKIEDLQEVNADEFHRGIAFWKEEILKTIHKTATSQWDTYFSQLYTVAEKD